MFKIDVCIKIFNLFNLNEKPMIFFNVSAVWGVEKFNFQLDKFTVFS